MKDEESPEDLKDMNKKKDKSSKCDIKIQNSFIGNNHK